MFRRLKIYEHLQGIVLLVKCAHIQMHFDGTLRSLSGVLWHKLLQRQAHFVENKDMAGWCCVIHGICQCWLRLLDSMSPMHDGARLARRHVLLSVSWRQRIHRLCSRCEIDDVMEKCWRRCSKCRLLSRKFEMKRIIERLQGLFDWFRISSKLFEFMRFRMFMVCVANRLMTAPAVILSFCHSFTWALGALRVCLAREAGPVSRR